MLIWRPLIEASLPLRWAAWITCAAEMLRLRGRQMSMTEFCQVSVFQIAFKAFLFEWIVSVLNAKHW